MSGAAGVPFADLVLARRLERAEAESSARFVEARARLVPASGACWIALAGAYAMFDGVASPVTQTFGLGMFQTPTASDLEQIEDFFHERGAPAHHEVSPLADPALVPLLNERGYRPFEFTSVMYRPIEPGGVPARPSLAVRRLGEDEQELYARVAAEGWRESGYGDFMLEIGRVSASTDGLHLFIAELDGVAIAAGAVHLRDGVAHLAGASTIPAGRRRGAQLALLEQRLQHAAAHGCDIALMGASPGSGSQRNAERHGFRIAYTRVKWKQ
jgi:GNAT superfamily N-acetyltransferase